MNKLTIILKLMVMLCLLTSCKGTNDEQVEVNEGFQVTANYYQLNGELPTQLFPNADAKLIADWETLLADAKLISASISSKHYKWSDADNTYVAAGINEMQDESFGYIVHNYAFVAETKGENGEDQLVVFGSFEHNFNMDKLPSNASSLGYSIAFNTKDAILSKSSILHYLNKDDTIPVAAVFSGIGWENGMNNDDFPSSGTFSMKIHENKLEDYRATIFSRLDVKFHSQNQEQLHYRFNGSQLDTLGKADVIITSETKS
ncbi:hypothetical protein I6N90_13575 [Paenibacillus sp. GSMTC-2017]|uniref:hypothetical protein n=1 Tax=Paenibacillus sp. GSMTC-2017 TaxID=2794350 RepID=UPI0018D71080|nr:hypothetical protein [Paenibacillus sp. GSMTC-2017]MBH5318829.1 hypothetical protein [Paenibacillus sp. GSMTC-2017]